MLKIMMKFLLFSCAALQLVLFCVILVFITQTSQSVHRKDGIDLKNKLFLKALSLTAAAAIGCTGLAGTGVLSAAAAESAASASASDAYSAPVQVIVKVAGEAVLNSQEASGAGAAYLETGEAVEKVQQIASVQDIVADEIAALYPELKIGYRYSILCNGFSCMLPPELLDAVRALPYVEGVSRVKNITVPQMATAKALGAVESYYDVTGCYGEGRVVAVIDTELDTTHPMFAPMDDSIETALSKEDIAEVVNTIGLNIPADPDRAYLSNKLPYVVDYVDADPYGDVPDTDSETFHGTHVAGIAAGNAFVDADGKEISGIAKNAQILFFATGIHGTRSVDITAVIAATEDAVKLHADVINMSFGGAMELFEDEENSVYTDLYRAAENAGIVICKSAGNDGDGSDMGFINQPENPDVTQLCDEPADSAVLTVAAADNKFTLSANYMMHGGDKLPYTLTDESEALNEVFAEEMPYVFCGLGYEQDFAGKDLTGKIALVRRGEITFTEKAAAAAAAGAVGIIIINYPGEKMFQAVMDPIMPGCVIEYASGEALLADENGTVSFVEGTMDIPIESAVSSFSSWGVKQSLKCEPDIMGIGGQVESAAYNEGTKIADGTSMSSPYLAGCTAVVCEYLEKQGIQLSGSEKVRYIRNLLMNSAVPYEEDGMYVTPRRQGAGLVNLNNLLADKVIMTNDENDAKINLYDKLTDSFGFDINLSNISDEDVSFSEARLVLTTMDSEMNEDFGMAVISGQQPLNASADCSALCSVAAGESRTEHIEVSLDAAQTAAIMESFVNGFFVEGYLLLSGADNCCDISVPVLGFYGDWAALPIFNEAAATPVIPIGAGGIMAGTSVSNAAKAVKEIIAQIPAEELEQDNPDLTSLIFAYGTQEQLMQLYTMADGNYVSPNGDGLADTFGLNNENLRAYIGSGLDVYDADGNLVAKGEPLAIPGAHAGFTAEPVDSLEELEEGSYVGVISGHIDYQGAEEKVQTVSLPFVIDKSAPELVWDISEENGRTILHLTATDQALDGIFITGAGNGGLAGEYDPEAPAEASPDLLYHAATAVQFPLSEMTTFFHGEYDSQNLPVLGHILVGDATERELGAINFCDVIPAQPDENGSFTIAYDITDLSSYCFTAVDKAFNMSVAESEAADAAEFQAGLYSANDAYYIFDGKNVTVYQYEDGAIRTAGTYKFAKGKLTLAGEKMTVKQINADTVRLCSDSAETTLRYKGEIDADTFSFYTTNQILNRVSTMIAEMAPDIAVTGTKSYTDLDGLVHVTVYADLHGTGQNMPLLSGKVDHLTGAGFSDMLGDFSLSPISFDDMAANVWKVAGNDSFGYWEIDPETGKVRVMNQADGKTAEMTYAVDDYTVTFDGEASYTYSILNAQNAILVTEEGTVTYMFNTGAASLGQLGVYTNPELGRLALDFFGDKKLKEKDVTFEPMTDSGTIAVILGDGAECYVVDPLTAAGTDSQGNPVDLLSTQEPAEDIFRSSVWCSAESYYCFGSDNTGVIVDIATGDSFDFTYEMRPDGLKMTVFGMETFAQTFPQEDGSVCVNWIGNDSEQLICRKDVAADAFRFTPIENLKNMALMHAPFAAADAQTVINPDGTVTIVLLDETGSAAESYTVDPVTLKCADSNGTEQDLSQVYEPELPAGAFTRDELADMAVRDYAVRKDGKAASASAFVNRDGSVAITLYDEDDNILDTYTVDPMTGQGTDESGAAVDLPQTGNNVPTAAASAAGAVLLMLAGAFLMQRSGILRRKQDQEA